MKEVTVSYLLQKKRRQPEEKLPQESDQDESEESAEEYIEANEEESGPECSESVPSKVSASNGDMPPAVPKLSRKDLYKVPTNEELSQLRETENLYHSSLFRMQVREVVNYKTNYSSSFYLWYSTVRININWYL